MMLRIYKILMYVALPFLVMRLWIKSWKQPDYGKRISERLGRVNLPKDQKFIWIHAVSLGEVILAAPLIKSLLQSYPNDAILLTTSTATGTQRAQALYSDAEKSRVYHAFSPFDVSFAINSFLKVVRPKMAVMMETEIWPGWFDACAKNEVPLFIANGRLSSYSLSGYQKLSALIHKTLNKMTHVCVQTEEDGARFKALGVPSEKLSVMGNIKFDSAVPENIHEQAKLFRAHWEKERLVWIAASTHPGEEEIVLEAFQRIKQEYPTALLILVPRHPERAEAVMALCEQNKFTAILRTDIHENLKVDVIVGNTIGEMMLLLAASDVAFVGGSLTPIGGHNILEPAALYVPVVTGPQMFNFQKIYDEFVHAESLITVENASSLARAVNAFFADPYLREEYASLGFKIIEANRGALEKHILLFKNYVS